MTNGNNGSSFDTEKISTKNLKNYKSQFIKGGYFDVIIEKFKPRIIFLDISKIGFFPELIKKNIKFAILATKVSLNKESFIPPFSSSFIPFERSLLTRIICELEWFKVLFGKKIDNLIKRARNGGFCLYDLPFEYLKANKLYGYREFINSKRVSNFGLIQIPEFILSPKEFDFPGRKTEKNQVYLGPTVYNERNESISTELNKFIKKENLVLCAMGSYDSKYQKTRLLFLKRVIKAFKENPRLNVLISVGRDFSINTKNQLAPNVLICHSVPQLKVLKFCRAMISHGGMQSITESILSCVPLIIYPLNLRLDQKGNAARIKYHNVGMIGNIRHASSEEIIQKVKNTITNENISQNLRKLSNIYHNSKDFDNGMKFIFNYIND